jgi:hypothetical protein
MEEDNERAQPTSTTKEQQINITTNKEQHKKTSTTK